MHANSKNEANGGEKERKLRDREFKEQREKSENLKAKNINK